MKRRPVVTVTMAQSLDGRLATATGDSQWISGDETLTLAQELRRDTQCVMVGIGTVLADNPRLTCRLPGAASPTRAILDSALRTPTASEVVSTAGETPTLIYVAAGVDRDRVERYRSLGVDVIAVAADASRRPALDAVLADLHDRGVANVLVEGGAGVITSFIRQRLVDRLIVVMAPLVIGEGISSIGDLGVRALADAIRGRTVGLRRLGQDVVWEVDFDRE